MLQDFIDNLNARFALKDMGELHHFLGIEVRRGKNISRSKGEKMADPSLYRSAIGGLQYLAHTRPDITFDVNKMSQFLQTPSDVHWKAVKRIFRYLKGTIEHGLWIQRSYKMSIIGFADADWASCPDDRRSTVGYCVYLGDTLVAWSSKKQHVVARSKLAGRETNSETTVREIKVEFSLAVCMQLNDRIKKNKR
ncbi:uncharacterized protein LOC111392999 [Olea europaea var. sylvestris]|uniref:uncharacterized protein LOC111392999 n=1 Tax=Olea europaea var. sylvestris TaxID=158386 RepID=UPI000C1D208D|nr:uncharacterized protein LOC111392999 [Olea europaea var. sylvestris]